MFSISTIPVWTRSAPSHQLFEAMSVRKREGVDVARSFSDYEVVLDHEAVPDGVTVIEK